MIPIIPIVAVIAIIGGVSTLVWYASLSVKQQEQADNLALKWFGKKFKELAKAQQKKIKDEIEGQ